MLIVAGPVDLNENSEQKENVEKEGLCNACMWRQNTKSSRLEAIKIQILSKLRLETAPNISKDAIRQLLPKAPPLPPILQGPPLDTSFPRTLLFPCILASPPPGRF